MAGDGRTDTMDNFGLVCETQDKYTQTEEKHKQDATLMDEKQAEDKQIEYLSENLLLRLKTRIVIGAFPQRRIGCVIFVMGERLLDVFLRVGMRDMHIVICIAR